MPQTHTDDLCPIRRRGKRTLTPAMLKARDELLGVPPDYPDKYAVLNTIRALPRTFPLTRSARGLLERMIEKTRPESWETLSTPFIYAHNATLMSWTGLSLTTLRRAVRELAEAGMIVPCDGRNGQRGRRWQGQEGMSQVGFSLASLRYRWPDLQAQLEIGRRQRAEVAFLREAIADLNEQVRVAAELRNDEATAMEAARIMRLRRGTDLIDTLASYHDIMKALWARVKPVEKPAENRVDRSPDSVWCTPEMAPMDAQSGTHYTERNNKKPKEVVVVAPERRNRIETMRREGQVSQREPSEGLEATILRGFPGTSTFFLTVCPALRDLCGSASPDRAQLTDAAELLSGQIGIGYHSWKTGCIALGRFEAAVAVIVMATRKDQGEQIRHPDAYFRALVERGVRGTLHLDRSLYALKDILAQDVSQIPERATGRVKTASQPVRIQ
ncbi:replication initiation protein RepC [Acetobacter ghanensis]|uniref:Replication protein C n=1 Tax=Acetobacter ghanensis TaxID=431306 RepID=A0A0U5F727_9PROT|nr:replication initiation protein RepC [Acetobacter ghanensis]NHO40553.1 replicator initiator RepC [Acetobacter ghanensis]CEF57394.1 replication protein C [Acetobacter ghanensis]CEF57446.1 replication protein C [Acetobacter ghanensis]